MLVTFEAPGIRLYNIWAGSNSSRIRASDRKSLGDKRFEGPVVASSDAGRRYSRRVGKRADSVPEKSRCVLDVARGKSVANK